MRKFLAVSFLVLLVNTAYIAAFAQPTIFYMGNVLLHVLLGLALFLLCLLPPLRHSSSSPVAQVSRPVFRVTPIPFTLAAAFGLYLTIAGNTRDHHPILIAHIAAAALGLAALIPFALKQGRTFRTAYITAL